MEESVDLRVDKGYGGTSLCLWYHERQQQRRIPGGSSVLLSFSSRVTTCSISSRSQKPNQQINSLPPRFKESERCERRGEGWTVHNFKIHLLLLSWPQGEEEIKFSYRKLRTKVTICFHHNPLLVWNSSRKWSSTMLQEEGWWCVQWIKSHGTAIISQRLLFNKVSQQVEAC